MANFPWQRLEMTRTLADLPGATWNVEITLWGIKRRHENFETEIPNGNNGEKESLQNPFALPGATAHVPFAFCVKDRKRIPTLWPPGLQSMYQASEI